MKRKKVERVADEYLLEHGLKLVTKIRFIDPALLKRYGGTLPKRLLSKPKPHRAPTPVKQIVV
jgi:hypothetical protein